MPTKPKQRAARRKKHPKLIVEKLGRYKAWGLYECMEGPKEVITNQVIKIDPRMKPKLEMEVMIHEFEHYLHPDWSESRVDKEAVEICEWLWKHGFRRVKL